MKEDFLHFVWQFQRFDKTDLKAVSGENLSILKVGHHNKNAGPDFENARLVINDIEWAGNVEIHVRSSDWQSHQHQQDKAYENVILHVVWEDNKPVYRQDGSPIATIELKSRVSEKLVQDYEAFINNSTLIPCQNHIQGVSSLAVVSMLDKTLTNRLERKAQQIEDLWQNTQQDFEETAYQTLGQSFGFKINAAPFLQLSQSLPIKVLRKHRDSLFQIEALLFGQAGFLEDVNDEYSQKLQTEYRFLAEKYQLKNKVLEVHQWKFAKLRPANFPTVRIAQFAKLIQTIPSFFSFFVETKIFEELQAIFKIKMSDYWQNHYRFGVEANGKLGNFGKDSMQNVIINSVAPMLAFIAKQYNKEELMLRATEFLEKLPAEKNQIVEKWEIVGLKTQTAFDSQAVLELYQYYCTQKKCLYCQIGVDVILHKNTSFI